MFKKKTLERSFPLKGIDNGHYNIEYKGVKCLKCPFDYVIYQMIVNEVNPDLIIEIGTNEGGSTLYLADLLELQGNGTVHSIDIKDDCPKKVKEHGRIKLFTDGWESYDLNLTREFKKILVIEDSSHQYENTLGAIKKFNSIVTIGSYLIVEDGIIDDLGRAKEFNGGPLKAIKEFLTENLNFSIDQRWIDFFGNNATFNPMGYLKKTN
ncbi:MAG: cephalosporin hydroxylase [Crocinitomix sp.]|jgi:cephalosporin hydroxylase